MDKNEKIFKTGQLVRIVGPTVDGVQECIGKCFMIVKIEGTRWINGPYQYCTGYSGCSSNHIWPAESLELVENELEYIINRFNAIEKRLADLESKAKGGTSAQESAEFDYKLYGVICKKPGSGVYELAKELGWSSDKVYGSIRHLVRDGWIMAVRDGRSALKIVPVKWHEFLTPEEIEEFKKGDLGVE